MTQIAHTRDTASPTGELAPKYLYKAIQLLMPEEATFMAFLMNIDKDKTVGAFKFFWYDKPVAHRWTKVNLAAGYLSTDTTIVVDNEEYAREGDVIFIPRTGERCKVTGVSTTGSSWTITRSLGATAAAALVDNDDIVIIGNMNEQGAVARPIKTEKETEYYNYTQIIRTPFGITNTAEASEDLNDLNQIRKDELITHRKDLERTIIFGERSYSASGTHPVSTTSGLLEFLTTYCSNWVDLGTIPTEDEFENFCEMIFKYGSKKKIFLCSRSFITEINRWGRHKLQMGNGTKEYGVAITKYISAHGELTLIPADSLEGAVYGYYGIALDPKYVELVHLKDRKIKHNTGIQENSADEKQEEYLSEIGLRVWCWDAHGVAYYNQ